ncbi:MAG: adenylate/guanylate cyclase domain-containing protein [Tannerella sp.]|nr:adenylate/guanylate cyclase domain-containing protein [Tannerella sp.]
MDIQKIENVTVMFADIDDFYDYSRKKSSEQLLLALDDFFSYFDEVAERFHLRKIKTIGDAYMCAGGIPAVHPSNPADVVRAALDVQQHLNRLREQNPDLWSVRFGIHTGEVYAGFLGKTQLTYDIWGATVNLAARIESMCPKGKIQISDTTFELVKKDFTYEYAGDLPEKLGTGKLYLVINSIKN